MQNQVFRQLRSDPFTVSRDDLPSIANSTVAKALTQNLLDQFILERGQEVAKSTLNKDIPNMTTFLNWAVRSRFVSSV